MSSQGKELIFTIDELFRKHDSSLISSDVTLTSKSFILSKTQRLRYIGTFVDMTIHPDVRNLPEYSKIFGCVFNRLFKLCNDDCEDIRIYSEDCLSKLIVNLQNTYIHRILRQLQLEMTNNGFARSVRSALRRYAHLLPQINRQYLRPFLQELILSLAEISTRSEETLLDELEDSFLIMSPHISGLFSHDNIQVLIMKWLPLLTSYFGIQRRVASSILVSLVSNCIHSSYYSSKLLQFILGLVPSGQGNVHTILGVISCLRNFSRSIWVLSSSNIRRIDHLNEVTAMFDSSLNVYFPYILQAAVFTYHCTSHSNHNIVNAALDTLADIISSSNLTLVQWLLHDQDTRFQLILEKICYENPSFVYHDKVESSRETNNTLEDTVVHIESELFDTCESFSFQETSFADNVSDTSASNESGESMDEDYLCNDAFSVPVNTPTSTKELSVTSHDDVFESSLGIDLESTISQCLLDDDVHLFKSYNTSNVELCPLIRIIRRICQTNLLSGIPGCILPYESSLTSIQNSSIKLLTTVMFLQHDLLFINLFSNNCFFPPQKLLDVFLYLSHTDPSTVEKTCLLSSAFIKYYLKSFSSHLDSLPCLLTHILKCIVRLMQSPNGFLARASCIALKQCLPELILYCYGSPLLNYVIQFLDVKYHSFWLVRIELCNLLAVIDWGYLSQLSTEAQLPEYLLLRDYVFDHIFRLYMSEEDPRVRESFHHFVLSLLRSYCAVSNYSYGHCRSYQHKISFPVMSTSDILAHTIAKFSDFLIDYESQNQFISATNILSSIALDFQPYNYPTQWGLLFSDDSSSSTKCLSLSVLPILFERLNSSMVVLHSSAHCDILSIIHSIFNGCFVLLHDFNFNKIKLGLEFSSFILPEHISIIDSFFLHLMRLLRIFHLVISNPKFDLLKKRMKLLGILKEHSETSISSKRENINAKAKLNPKYTASKSSTWIGKFSHLPSFIRLLHVVKNLYFVFQHSIEHDQSDKFLLLLRSVLYFLDDFLSYPISTQLYLHTQEILYYLSSTFHILPGNTLMVIEKLATVLYRKDVFQISSKHVTSNKSTLFDVLYLLPLSAINGDLSVQRHQEFFNSFNTTHTSVGRNISTPKMLKTQPSNVQKVLRIKLFSRKMDKLTSKRAPLDSTLFSFKRQIKHFEEILTVYLSIYISTTYYVQTGVVSLLIKLICFQLNYSLIDPNLQFLERIIAQVESFDKGLFSEEPAHLSAIFQLLILISVTKPDILSFSKVIILCESVIASCDSKSSNSVFAVQAIYFHIFPEDYSNQDNIDGFYIDFFRNRRLLYSIDTTHRDIVFNLLIRLIEYSQSTILLANILQSTIPQELQWIESSLLVIGPWLQKMKRLQIHLDNPDELTNMQSLLFSLHPSSAVPISLFFLSLNSTEEINLISSALRWIAGALLISKLCLWKKRECDLLSQLKEFVITLPKIYIPLCLQTSESAIGEGLTPEQTYSDFIYDVLSKSSLMLLNLGKQLKVQNELFLCIEFLSDLISQFLALILWMIKDYSFKSIRLCMMSSLLTLSMEYSIGCSSKNNLIAIFYQLQSDYPILFSKFMHLVLVEAQAPTQIWYDTFSNDSNQSQFYNMSEKYTHTSFILDILHQICLDASRSIHLLSKFNVIQILVFFQDEIIVSRFLDFLKSDPDSSVEIINQLKRAFLMNHSPIFIKKCISLFKYIHISAVHTYISTLSDLFSISRHPGLYISIKLYFLYSNDVSISEFTIFSDQIIQSSFESYFTESNFPDFVLRMHDIRCPIDNDVSLKEIQTIFIDDKTDDSLRHRHFQWYFPKINRSSKGFNIISIENLLPFKTFTDEELLSIFEMPTFGFDALLFIIEFCSFKISDNRNIFADKLQEEELYEVGTIRRILKQCISYIFRYISEKLYGSGHSLIFEVTRCLVAVFDGSSIHCDPAFNSYIASEVLFFFGFLHFQHALSSTNHSPKVEWLITAFLCPSYILRLFQMQHIVMKHLDFIVLAVSQFYQFILQTLAKFFVNTKQFIINKDTSCPKVIEELNILLNFLPTYLTEEYFPSTLLYPIRSLLLAFCHLQMFYCCLIVPLTLWDEIPLFEFNKALYLFPQPPNSILQDPSNLFELLKRIATLGWKTKDQFEEIWSLIIRVLVPSSHGINELHNEEILDMMKVSCIAVEGVITHLLSNFLLPTPGLRHPSYGLDMQTFGDSSIRWLHSSHGILLNICDTDDLTFLHTKAGKKLHEFRKILEVAYEHVMPYRRSPMFSPSCKIIPMSSRNIERPMDYIGYITIQFYHPPLLQIHSPSSLTASGEGIDSITDGVRNIGLLDVNLPSCIRLLSDLSENWTSNYPENISLMFLHSVLKSMLFLSDLFTDELQFEILLQSCLHHYFHHHFDDINSRVYLTLSILKSAAAIQKDIFEIEKMYEVIINGLLSNSPSVSLSSFEGLLFLLRSKHRQCVIPIIPNISSAIVCRLEDFQDMSNGLHQRLLLVVISVGFSLIQSNKHLFEDKEFSSSFVSQLIQYCMLPYNFSNSNVILAILQTFERLILGFSLEQIDRTSILTLAIFFINYTISSAILFASLSLFIVCMYTGEDVNSTIGVRNYQDMTQLETDPMTHNIDLISQTRDKVSILLKKIRKNPFLDSQYIAQILVHVLLDLLPSNQSMTTIISEFLDKDQFNKPLIAWIMYKLFQMLIIRGQEKEVRIWALLCIDSFGRCASTKDAVWNLSCLFISTSNNSVICGLFPTLLARNNTNSSWITEVFLYSAESFYATLERDDRNQFKKSFEQLNVLHPIFSNLLYLDQ